jgi:outer membrane protein assembly factor BamB
MKKENYFYILLSLLLLSSCSSKEKIKGNRIQIFATNESIVVDNKLKVEIDNTLKTYTDYYGDYSPLNEKVENFKTSAFDFKKSYFSNPLAIKNNIYYIDGNGKLNGKYPVIDNPKFAKISYHDEVIYIVSGRNNLVAIGLNGEIKWKKDINSIIISSPIVYDDSVFFITQDNKTYSLDIIDGSIKWIHFGKNQTTKIFGVANPLLYKNYLIVAYSSGEIFILNKKNANVIFSYNLSNINYLESTIDLNDIDSTPVIKNDILFASANNGFTVAIDINSFKILWKEPIYTLANILINNDNIFLIDENNKLVALDMYSGHIKWLVELPNDNSKNFYRSLLFTNNMIVAFSEKNYIFVDIDGKILNDNKTNLELYSLPITIDGIIYGIGKYF